MLVFTTVGFNNFCSDRFVKVYHSNDLMCANYVRYLRLNKYKFNLDVFPLEDAVRTVCWD